MEELIKIVSDLTSDVKTSISLALFLLTSDVITGCLQSIINYGFKEGISSKKLREGLFVKSAWLWAIIFSYVFGYITKTNLILPATLLSLATVELVSIYENFSKMNITIFKK